MGNPHKLIEFRNALKITGLSREALHREIAERNLRVLSLDGKMYLREQEVLALRETVQQ